MKILNLIGLIAGFIWLHQPLSVVAQEKKPSATAGHGAQQQTGSQVAWPHFAAML